MEGLVAREKSISIAFEDVVYTKGQGFRKEKKQILYGISGSFPSGHLVGILGPSGAGKSSLLNILSGYERHNYKGRILVNGKDRNLAEFKKSSCYITQDNDLNELLTVEENMKYSADFKLGPNVSNKTKENIIESIINTLGLSETKATRTAKLSGGQKKRLCIAQELINDPMVMFLDEPTTGLDILAGHRCMEHLKHLVGEGRTIICTIHQPSATMFHLFDIIYVIADGRCLYQGDVGHLMPFLESIGAPCNKYHNPADHVIEVASGDYGSNKIELMVDHIDNGKKLNLEVRKTDLKIGQQLTVWPKKSGWYELGILAKREIVKLRRNMTLTHLRLFGSVMISVALGAIYWDVGNDASKMWFNYNLVIVSVFQNIVGGLMLTVLEFPKEFRVLKKETFNRYYSMHNHFLAVTLVDLPLSFVCCIIASVGVYFLTSQPADMIRIVIFVSTSFLVSIISQSVGLLIGTVMDMQSGIATAMYTHFPMMIISGFTLNFSDMPDYIFYLSYLSYLRYGVRTMTSAIFLMDRPPFPCPEDKFCMYTSGQKFLDDLGLGTQHFIFDFMMMVVFYLAFRTLAFMLIRTKLCNKLA